MLWVVWLYLVCSFAAAFWTCLQWWRDDLQCYLQRQVKSKMQSARWDKTKERMIISITNLSFAILRNWKKYDKDNCSMWWSKDMDWSYITAWFLNLDITSLPNQRPSSANWQASHPVAVRKETQRPPLKTIFSFQWLLCTICSECLFRNR